MRLSLRVALNSALMILGVYLVQQTMSYFRDMIMLGAPGLADYPGTVAGFVGPFVLPPLVIFTLVLYLSARPLERTLEALRRGDSLAPELLESTRLRMLRFSGLVLALNLVGFAAGFLVLLAVRGQLAELLRVERLVVLLSNVSCGVCFASAQNALNDRAFGELRDRLRLREIGDRKRQPPTTTRSFVLGLFLALYAVCFLQWNLRDVSAVQATGAEALRAELSGAVPSGGAAEEYRRLLAERLGSVSSRSSLDFAAIPAPWERGSWLGVAEGAFLTIAAYLAAVAAFVLATYYKAQRERLEGITARLREFAAEGGKAEGRIDLRSMDDLGEVGEGVNRLLDGFAALRAGISRAAAQARAAAAETESALSRAEADAARAGAALRAREAEIAAQGEGSRAVARALEELREAAARAGSAAESQRRLVEETSAATEEIAASIGSVAELSARAAALNEGLAARGASGKAAAAETADAIAGIADSANGVLEVLGALGKIASSTNLLAMNAAIEAAHAGAAGAGFAVVADEVRALASDAAARTKDIRRIVAEMRSRVGRGVAASDSSGEAASGLSLGIEESAAISRDIGGAMREQAAGTRQVADALTRLVAAGAEISAAMEGQEAAVERSSASLAEALRRLEAEAAASRRQAEDFRSVLAAFAELRRGMDGTLAASEALAGETGL